jgi:hypothetical protein
LFFNRSKSDRSWICNRNSISTQILHLSEKPGFLRIPARRNVNLWLPNPFFWVLLRMVQDISQTTLHPRWHRLNLIAHREKLLGDRAGSIIGNKLSRGMSFYLNISNRGRFNRRSIKQRLRALIIS